MNRSCKLIMQPYGAAFIDKTGKVCFFNETAAEICKCLAEKMKYEDVIFRIANAYDITMSEAQTDIDEFLSSPITNNCLIATQGEDVQISGSEDYVSIIEADICLTNRCNLQCTYCYANAGSPNGDELPPDKWLETARSLIRLGMQKVTIAGGEPLLSQSLIPILDVFSDNDISVQIFSNGALIDKKILKELCNYNINFIQISMDAITPEKHNRHRGQSHNEAVKAIHLIAESDIPVVIGANIFPDTLDEIIPLSRYAASLGALLRCNPIEARGRGSSFSTELTVTNESFTNKLHDSIEDASALYPQVFAEQEITRNKDAMENSCPFSKGCIAVTSNGEIRACSQSDLFFETIAPWSIDHKKVWDYALTIEEHAAFSAIANINPKLCPTRELCGNCLDYPSCSGCLLAGYTCHERR